MRRGRRKCGRWASARRPAAAVAAVLALLAVAPAGAGAHAVLTHSSPHRGATVSEAPPLVEFDFNEPIEAGFGSVRVFDADGERVDEGDPEYPRGDQSKVAVRLRGGLGRGVYTATYRVVSADGHPVSGGFSFGVGVAANSGSAPSVADLLGKSDAGAAVEGSYGVVRGLHYAALLLMIGSLAFWALVWGGAKGPSGGGEAAPVGAPAPGPRWPGALLLAAATLGFLTSAAGFPLQGLVAAGAGLGHVFDRTVLEVSYDSRTGFAWAGRTLIWLAVIALVFAPRPPGRLRAALLGAAGLLLALSLPYGGHARTQSPEAVLVPADVAHVLAAGTWLGGLVLLLAVFWPRREPAGSGHAAAAEATRRFSRMALPAVAILLAAGSLQAWFYLGSPGELFDGSTYSLALLAKIALLGAVVALAAGNRRRTARLTGGSPAPSALRRAMRAEVALAVLVLAATAVLVREAPPEAAATGPAERELDLGPMRLEMVIEPAKVGPNDFHLYFFDRKSGAQVDRVKEVTVRLTQKDKNIGPLRVPIPRKGVAHHELLGQPLGVPGEWEVAVDARVSEFDAFTAETKIEVRKK